MVWSPFDPAQSPKFSSNFLPSFSGFFSIAPLWLLTSWLAWAYDHDDALQVLLGHISMVLHQSQIVSLSPLGIFQRWLTIHVVDRVQPVSWQFGYFQCRAVGSKSQLNNIHTYIQHNVLNIIRIIISMLKISRILRSFSKLEQRLPKQQPIRKKKGVSARRISLLGMTAFLAYMIYHHRRQSQFEFLMHNSQLNRQIIQNNKQLNQEQYKPSIYFAFSFLEMLYAHYIEAKKEIRIDRQEVVEGCSIDYMAKSARDQNRDINSNTSIYAGCVIVVAGSEGLNELMANIMLLSTSNHYEAIGISVDDPFDTAKLTRIISRIKQQRKGKNFYGVGIEYGANLLVLAAANNPDLFNCIVSIGNPLDLIQAQTKVQNSKIAQLTFLSDMIKGRIQKSKANIPHNTPLPQLTKLIYNIPTQDQVLKFKHTNSSINHISKLKTPALFLNSKQDPFSIQLQNDERIQSNTNTIFVVTKRGGHNEWYQSLHIARWAPRLVVSHLKSVQAVFKKHPELLQTAT